MKRFLITCMIAILFLPGLISAATTEEAAAAQVSVTNVTLDPQVLFVGDTGTVTIEITNSGTQSVSISRASIADNNIDIVGGTYDTVGAIGAGNKMYFTFTIKASCPEGIYYPKFSLDFRSSGSLRFPVLIRVQNTDLTVSVIEKPDTFSSGKKDNVKILVGNTRPNRVTGVTITPVGSSIDVTPTSYFIGNLDSNGSDTTTFSVTPEASTRLDFRVDYFNGINKHTTSLTMPVVPAQGKKQANPVLSNIEQKTTDGVTHVTGDVTNAGLEIAKSVVVSSGNPALPVDPYKEYVVGSLNPDDFSSFEITFRTQKGTSIPLVITYKDADGNVFAKESAIEINDGLFASSSASSAGPGGLPLTVIAVIIAVTVVVAGAIGYSWYTGRSKRRS
jgi:hypothetical protein